MAISAVYKRLTALAACLFSCTACGSLYLYSAYSTQVAERLQLTATDSSLIITFGTVGLAVMGYFCGCLIDRYRMTPIFASGAACMFVGYGCLYTAYQYSIRSVPLLCFALFVVGFASVLTSNTCLKAAALNFESFPGFAVSVPMCGFGLSAFLLSTVSGTIFAGDTSGLLMFLTLVPAGIIAISIPFVKVHVDPKTCGSQVDESAKHDGEQSEQQPLLSEPLTNENQDIGGLNILFYQRFWYLFALLFCTSCPGTMYIYGVGYIVDGLTYSQPGTSPEKIQAIQSVQVAVISISNSFSRIISGLLSDYIKNKYKSQRLWVIYLALLLFACGNICATQISDPGNLWVISCMIGVGYGIAYGGFPALVLDAFGVRFFGQNLGLICICQVFSTYGSSYLFGWIYDSNAEWVHGKWLCTKGIGCYQDSFVVSLVLNLVTMALLSYIIYVNYRSSSFFKKRSKKQSMSGGETA